jgi:hypothetical protein
MIDHNIQIYNHRSTTFTQIQKFRKNCTSLVCRTLPLLVYLLPRSSAAAKPPPSCRRRTLAPHCSWLPRRRPAPRPILSGEWILPPPANRPACFGQSAPSKPAAAGAFGSRLERIEGEAGTCLSILPARPRRPS